MGPIIPCRQLPRRLNSAQRSVYAGAPAERDGAIPDEILPGEILYIIAVSVVTLLALWLLGVI